jgi:hypothetical protein
VLIATLQTILLPINASGTSNLLRTIATAFGGNVGPGEVIHLQCIGEAALDAGLGVL